MDIKLTNGDTVVFPDKLKGKHVMAIRSLQGSIVTTDGSDTSMDVQAYFQHLYELFSVLCIEIKSDKKVSPTLEYLEELDAEDFAKIESYLMEVTQYEVEVKKK